MQWRGASPAIGVWNSPTHEEDTMKTIPQALRLRARRIFAAVFAEMASLLSGRPHAERPDPPHMRRRRVSRPWPKMR
jgi:hypothetical protein